MENAHHCPRARLSYRCMKFVQCPAVRVLHKVIQRFANPDESSSIPQWIWIVIKLCGHCLHRVLSNPATEFLTDNTRT